MKALLLFLFMLTLSATCLAAGAYKWVDEKGVTHYSDAPPASGTKVQPVDTRPYGPGGSGCSSCDWRALERSSREQPPAASAPAAPQAAAQSSARGMDYNTYIRLQVDMDEGELLSRAGPPDSRSVENLEGDIVKNFYYMPTLANPYITTVKLRAGRIVSIDRTKKN
jgi:uncharacterized protein DUF4124